MKEVIHDPLYGTHEIKEPVLIDLLYSPAVQRLRGISQLGLPQRFLPWPVYDRLEHSVGVMLILRMLGASVEEQAAGLTHDVSHSAFSHLVDWVIGDRTLDNHQDNNHERIMRSSTIPTILEKHGLDTERIIDVDQHSLLERPAPDLCADRWDYAIRELYMWARPEIVQPCLDNLINVGGHMAFKSKDAAQMFAHGYTKLQMEHWGSPEGVMRYEIMSRALKRSLEIGSITVEDFDLTDEEVIAKIVGRDSQVEKYLDTLKTQGQRLNLVRNEKDPQFNTRKKFRYIDPHYLDGTQLRRLSDTDSAYRASLVEQKAFNERGIKVDLVGVKI